MRAALALAVFLAAACASAATDPAADIRERSAALSRAESARNVEAALAFWTSSAVVQMEGAPALRGRAAIEQMYRHFFEPLVSFWSETHEVRVAASGELAYELGTSHLTTRESGLQKIGLKQSTTKYLAIWTRGKDGVWRLDALSLTRNP